MEVMYTNEDYKEMQKEVCYIMNDLKQLTDTICSSQYWNDFTLQANATCSAQALCDRLKNFLVQMNFITCNVASGGGVKNDSLFDFGADNNSDTVDNSTGDNMELLDAEEGNKAVLEDSKTESVEEGNKQDIELLA